MLPKRESQRHKDAFEFYYRMKKRSLSKVAKKFKVSTTTTCNWNKAFNWEQRINARDEKARIKTEEKVTDAIAEMNARHIKMWNLVQARALQTLQEKPFENAGSAAHGLKVSVDGERVARGAPTEHVEHSGGVKVVFEDAVTDGSNSRKAKSRKRKGDP